jgi:antitoxin component YwqK of YwqJK toxin-antitoxin module
MEGKMDNYLQCFKKVYFSDLYGTEEGNKILNAKMNVLDLVESECRIKEEMLIDKYQRYSILLEEFETKINSGNKIIISELNQIKSELGLTEVEIFRLRMNNKLNMLKKARREDYIVYFGKDKKNKIEFKELTQEEMINILTKDEIEEPHEVFKGEEVVRAYKLTNEEEEIVFQVELVTLRDIRGMKFTYEGKLYSYYSPIIKNQDNDCFCGTFVDGDFINGKVYHKGQLVFEGRFKNYILNGNGKSYSNGQVFEEGEFNNGVLNGRGKRYEKGLILEEGEFSKGILNGFGKKYIEGQLFEEGQFINGILNGEGKRYTDKYRREEGSFLNGKLNGKGKIYNGENLFREGDFKDGVLNGIGKVYYDDGKSWEEGEFENGELVKSIRKEEEQNCSGQCSEVGAGIDSNSTMDAVEICPYCGSSNIGDKANENKEDKTTAVGLIKEPIKRLNGFINSKTGLSGKDVVKNGKKVVNMCIDRIKKNPKDTK